MHARGDKTYAGWAVYFATAAGLTKVGYSGDVQRRVYMIGWERGATLRLTGVVAVQSEADARLLEKFIHERLRRLGFHFDGEWFDMADADVRGELDRLQLEGHRLLSGLDTSPPERISSPRHHHSDASGRKFAGIAAR